MNERHYCTRPFEFFETYDDGSIGFCCPSWYNNYEIGNINDNSIEEVWNGEAAQELRRSILDGSFRYCDESGRVFKGDFGICDDNRGPMSIFK